MWGVPPPFPLPTSQLSPPFCVADPTHQVEIPSGWPQVPGKRLGSRWPGSHITPRSPWFCLPRFCHCVKHTAKYFRFDGLRLSPFRFHDFHLRVPSVAPSLFPKPLCGHGALGRQSGHGCRQRPVPSQLHTFISNDEEKRRGQIPFRLRRGLFVGLEGNRIHKASAAADRNRDRDVSLPVPRAGK